jgi:Ca2+-binding EF-hand superfamily protein
MSMGISSISSNMSFDPTEMFKKLDKNSDGGVTKEEFLAGIKKQDGDTDEKLAKMFEETDSDGDGIITEAENKSMMEKMQKQGPPPPPSSSKSSSASKSNSSSSSSTTYDVKDTNKDGKVSVQEKLEYILKLLQENEDSATVLNEYNQSGEISTLSSSVSTTFSVQA